MCAVKNLLCIVSFVFDRSCPWFSAGLHVNESGFSLFREQPGVFTQVSLDSRAREVSSVKLEVFVKQEMPEHELGDPKEPEHTILQQILPLLIEYMLKRKWEGRAIRRSLLNKTHTMQLRV